MDGERRMDGQAVVEILRFLEHHPILVIIYISTAVAVFSIVYPIVTRRRYVIDKEMRRKLEEIYYLVKKAEDDNKDNRNVLRQIEQDIKIILEKLRRKEL